MVQQVSRKISAFDALPQGNGAVSVPVTQGSTTYKLSLALDGVDPCDPAFGAAGNGATDDNAALLRAVTVAASLGKPVCGFGRTYAISGNLTLVANAWLQDISFKQITPSAGSVRTIYSLNVSNIKLVRVTVNRNGTGTAGTHQVDAGVYIDGGSGHRFEDVEVYGDDIGSGFALWNATDSELNGVYAHDIKYSLASDPGNDRTQGIHIANCTRVTLRRCRAETIGGNFGAGFTLRYSRGYCYSGCTDIRVLGCSTRMVDQGNDATGGTGNTGFLFSDCYASDCLTYGFKAANTARSFQYSNCMTERCALSGFIASGPTGSGMTAVATAGIQYSGCVAYDTGYIGLPGVAVGGTKVGFRITNGTFDLNTTLGVRYVGCKAHDRQAVPTMGFGFWNDVAANVNGQYNEAISCVSIGHTGGSAFFGMHSARCEVNRTAVQSIPDSAWTSVDWDDEVADYGAMHSLTVNNDSIYARRAGVYRSNFGMAFTASGGGSRRLRIKKNGTVIEGTNVVMPAFTGGTHYIQTSWTSEMVEGDRLNIEVFQDSGGSLTLATASRGVVEQIG